MYLLYTHSWQVMLARDGKRSQHCDDMIYAPLLLVVTLCSDSVFYQTFAMNGDAGNCLDAEEGGHFMHSIAGLDGASYNKCPRTCTYSLPVPSMGTEKSTWCTSDSSPLIHHHVRGFSVPFWRGVGGITVFCFSFRGA